MHSPSKSLLVRADFRLSRKEAVDRLAYYRWRRVFIEALPRLLGCAVRCPSAERVCLHKGEEVKFSAWLRIPIERRPNRQQLRRLKVKLHGRLESGLKVVGGEVLKLGVRRCKKPQQLPLFSEPIGRMPDAVYMSSQAVA